MRFGVATAQRGWLTTDDVINTWPLAGSAGSCARAGENRPPARSIRHDSVPSGATGLLAGAISYALTACALIRPGEMTLPTPSPGWDLARSSATSAGSMADLETAILAG